MVILTPEGPVIVPIPPIPGIMGPPVEPDADRWLEQDEDNFHKQRVRIIAYKNAGSGSNTGYPVGRKLLGIKNWFRIETIAAAAAYNTKGPMFPEEDDTTFMAPSLKYMKAMSGGWEAHLVPVGSIYNH